MLSDVSNTKNGTEFTPINSKITHHNIFINAMVEDQYCCQYKCYKYPNNYYNHHCK